MFPLLTSYVLLGPIDEDIEMVGESPIVAVTVGHTVVEMLG